MTSETEMIYLGFPSSKEEEAKVEWDGKAFEKMKNLKTLIIKNGHFSEVPKHLPNSLRVLEWWRYPSQYLPSNFHPKKLSIFKFPKSCFMSLELVGKASVISSFLWICMLLTSLQDYSFGSCPFLLFFFGRSSWTWKFWILISTNV